MGRTDLPSGTVTFLFTDVEGSTRLLHALGAQAYAEALAQHRRILRGAFTRHGGVEVDTQGDAFFIAFPTAPGAVAAAREGTEALVEGPIRVRIGLHTGTPLLTDEGYVGPDVHKGARIAAAGHGGQVLVSAATAALLDEAALKDLGPHRLKDLAAPERIFQADPDEHPPLKTLHQTNLPVPATAFLGREDELRAIGALIARDEVRLVTLTGPGGTGKTRLALQAAASVADSYPGGVWWVPLAALRDPTLVLESAAAAMGASGDLVEHIGDKRLLVLFDNFEHVTPAATGLASLLSACPNLTLLVTSREPLHLAGEREYAVDPLTRSEAVELFLTRALAARRDFTANGEVVLICERLDYLPLAIELAAARVKALSPRALLERLDQRLPLLTAAPRDAPDRQRTLRATIEWSHELLTPDEQRLFARLAVFRGGCTLEAAEAVADADVDTLQSLVDKSLVRLREDDRYWMLETIREFATERLEVAGEADGLRRRHADFFLALAEAAAAAMGPAEHDPEAAVSGLKADEDNLRAALDHLTGERDGVGAQQLAGALWKFWYVDGGIGEGRRRLEAALRLDDSRTAIRARALIGANMASQAGDASAARLYSQEALGIYQELGDEFEIAHAEFMIAIDLANEGDWVGARALLARCRDEFERLGAAYYVLLAARVLASAALQLGDPVTARLLNQENLARARAAGNERIAAMSLSALAAAAITDNRLADAGPMVLEAYAIRRQRGDRLNIADTLSTMARLVAAAGRPRDAARLIGRTAALYDELGATVPPYDQPDRDALIAELRARLGPEYETAVESGRTLPDDDIDALLDEVSAHVSSNPVIS